jgi:hypothetical protein
MAAVGIYLTRNWVQRALKRMGLSFKQPQRKQVRTPACCRIS